MTLSFFRDESPAAKRAVIALLVVGACLRIGLAALSFGGPYDPHSRLRGDASDYVALGISLSRGEGFSLHYRPGLPEVLHGVPAPTALNVPTASRSPGYPLFLAAAFKLFGYRLHAVIALQILMSTLTPLLVYLTARALKAPALPALAFAVFYLPFAFDSVFLMSECLLTFCTAAALFLLIRPRRELLAGALGGVVVLVKAVSLPFFLLPAIIPGRRRGLFLAGFVAVVSPWALRNFIHTGVPHVAPSSGGYQALLLHNPQNGDFPLFDRPGDQNEDYPGFTDLVILASQRAPRVSDPVAQEYLEDGERFREAWRFMLQDPAQALRAALRSVANTWRVDIPSDHWRRGYELPSRLRWLSNIVLYAGLLLFALWGAIRSMRRGTPGERWLVAFILCFVAAHAPLSSQIRHRISAMPVFFVLAASGLPRSLPFVTFGKMRRGR